MRVILSLVCVIAVTGLSSCLAPNGNFSPWSGTSACNYTNYNDAGSGTSEDPYQICSAAQMESLAQNSSAWSSSFQLENDIDLAGAYLSQPIGNAGQAFSGVFNGQGHTLFNITLNSPTSSLVGVFGYVSDGTVANIAFVNLQIDAPLATDVGAIAINDNVVSGVRVMNSSITGLSDVGAIVGSNEGPGSVQNCAVAGTSVSGGVSVGGAVGANSGGGVILYSSVDQASSVTSTGTGIGGLLGTHSSGSITLEDCYSLATVSGATEVGGLIGSLQGASGMVVQQDDAGGSVSATAGEVGGLIGVYSCTSGNCLVQDVFAGTTVSMSSAGQDMGGLIGYVTGSTGAATLSSSYSAGTLTTSSNSLTVGGLVGEVDGSSSTIENSFSAVMTLDAQGVEDYVVGAKSGSPILSNLSYVSGMDCANDCNSEISGATGNPETYYQSLTGITSVGLGSTLEFGGSAWIFPSDPPGYPQLSGLPSMGVTTP